MRGSHQEVFCIKVVLKDFFFSQEINGHVVLFISSFFVLKKGSVTCVFVWILLNFSEHLFLQTTTRQLFLLIPLEIVYLYLINPCWTQAYFNVNNNLNGSDLWFPILILLHRVTWENSFSSILSELFCFDSCTSSKQQCSIAL